MTRAGPVGRNAACPCGSGKKFKRCCGAKKQVLGARERVFLIALICVVIAAIVVGITSFNQDAGSRAPQRVWSDEHGHWHTVP
ncbi:MAG: hypothetical protein GEV06_27765 [Luteitalea sp.]|nr:hypothetical protein [Luteitalea sp.]